MKFLALTLFSFLAFVACDTPVPVEHEKVVAPDGSAGAPGGEGTPVHGD